MKFVKRFLPLLLCAVMLLTACEKPGGSDATTPATTPAATEAPTAPASTDTPTEPATDAPEKVLTPRDPSAAMRVLFIGNSFTHYNQMNRSDGIFARIAHNAGYEKVVVSSIYKGGYYLHQFLDPTDTYGRQVNAALNSSTKYDIVVIQEQSAQPIANPADFYTACRDFKALIEKNGGEMWLYSTWGYKTGHSGLAKYGPTTQEMEMKLRAAYTAIGQELNVPVIYAGAAMTRGFETHPEIDLFNADLKHPSPAGSYLIAWTIFGTVFGVDPATLTYDGEMTASDAKALREVASYVVKNNITVDEKFRTESVGVARGESTAVQLKSVPKSPIISVIYRDDKTVGNGWNTVKSNSARTFSGIRGDKDAIASTAYTAKAGGLTDAQKADVADIGYGVSVIGLEYMDSSKKGTNTKVNAGTFTSVGNLVNGHWGSSYMAAMFFDENKYDINGKVEEDSPYTALITLNFGKVMKFDAIGYFSGSLQGFSQAQDVYVSDDGKTWTKIESACYDTLNMSLSSIDAASLGDPWNNNTPTVLAAFDMKGATGKYIRIGLIRGGVIDSNATGLEEINTREIVVFGSEP